VANEWVENYLHSEYNHSMKAINIKLESFYLEVFDLLPKIEIFLSKPIED